MLSFQRRSADDNAYSEATRGRLQQLDAIFQHSCHDYHTKQRIEQLERLFQSQECFQRDSIARRQAFRSLSADGCLPINPRHLLQELHYPELSLSPRLGIRASIRRAECPEREASPQGFVRSGSSRWSSRSLGSRSETIEEEDEVVFSAEEKREKSVLSREPVTASTQPFSSADPPEPELTKGFSLHADLTHFHKDCRRTSEGNIGYDKSKPPPLPPPRKPGLLPRTSSKTSLGSRSDCSDFEVVKPRAQRSQSVVEARSPLKEEFAAALRHVERASSLKSPSACSSGYSTPTNTSTPKLLHPGSCCYLELGRGERYIGTPNHSLQHQCRNGVSTPGVISASSVLSGQCNAQGFPSHLEQDSVDNSFPDASHSALSDGFPQSALRRHSTSDFNARSVARSRFSRADAKRIARRQNSYTFKPIQLPDTDKDNASFVSVDDSQLGENEEANGRQIVVSEWLQTMFPCLEPSDRDQLEGFIMQGSERAKRLLQKKGVHIPNLLQRSNSQENKLNRDDPKRPDFPCFWKTHARSPSDGNAEVASFFQEKTPDEPQGIFQRMFRARRSLSRERTPGASSTEGPPTPKAQEKKPRPPKSRHKPIEIKIKRYRSLSPRPHVDCPTPPLAIFSSDEDISSAPQTPQHQPSGMDPPTISPALENQISNLLLRPMRSRSPRGADASCDSMVRKPRPSSIATTGDYPQHKPPTGKIFRKSSAGVPLTRMHSLEQPPQIAPGPKPKTKYTQEYREKRHHTLDLGRMRLDSEVTGQVTTLRSKSMESKTDEEAKCLGQQCAKSSQLVIVLPQPEVRGQRSPQVRGQRSPGDPRPLETGSNDSGFQQDETPSSVESFKVLSLSRPFPPFVHSKANLKCLLWLQPD